LEIVQALEQFFDYASYYAALGHEEGSRAQAAASEG
jgi:antirestriction protein ArdC